MNKVQSFIIKNKVFIIGFLSAIALPLYELVNVGETSVKILAMSGFVAAVSYLARNLRGQWATIASSVGVMLSTYITQDHMGGTISWPQIILQGVILMLGATAPPAKSIGYEKTDIITEAKREGEEIKPTLASPSDQGK